MGNKLFVGGLSWNTTQDSLREAFEVFGEVQEAKIVTDRESGRSRGFGFVTFRDESSASAAQSKMDGEQLDGRSIRVSEANEREGGRYRGGSDGSRY
ncbi:RNA-binding protein [Candidatus Fermentibacteria bacterium]|nr:RNA-binding protein [Candidatus Fermentibacteria bacterium]